MCSRYLIFGIKFAFFFYSKTTTCPSRQNPMEIKDFSFKNKKDNGYRSTNMYIRWRNSLNITASLLPL